MHFNAKLGRIKTFEFFLIGFHHVWKRRITWLIESEICADNTGKIHFNYLDAAIDLTFNTCR